MTLYFVANARMPSEKAHGIHIAKMCEAFIEAGQRVVLVVPERGQPKESLREFYRLRVDIPTVYLPALRLFRYERPGYVLMSSTFIFAYMIFFLWKKIRGEKFVLYTVDLDSYSSSALALLRTPLYSEMHGGKARWVAQRLLFAYVTGIITINGIILKELQKTFPRSSARYLVEPNGVDSSMFVPVERALARTKLGLPEEQKITLYAGRFFDWKGLEIIPRAATASPHIVWQMVGGTREQFSALVKEPLPPNLIFMGPKPHAQMPLWISAADAVLVLGTVRDQQSYRWTSPMKLFEYLLMGRPIVAAGTPAIQEIVSEKEVIFYTPDDPDDLASRAAKAVSGGDTERIAAALERGKCYSWTMRAKRILKLIEDTSHGC